MHCGISRFVTLGSWSRKSVLLSASACSRLSDCFLHTREASIVRNRMHRASSSSVISRRLLSASLRHRNPAPPAVRESYLALSHFFRNYATTTTTTSPTSRLLLERTQAGHGRTSIRHLATTSLLREAAKEAAVQSSTPAEKGDAHGSATSSTSVQKPDHSPSAVAPYTEPNHDVLRHVSSFPASLRRLALSLPHSHLRRPTKEE